MEDGVKEIFLPSDKLISSGEAFEDPSFQMTLSLKWVFFDYSNVWKASLSCSIFLLLDVVVPLISHFFFSCTDCDGSHQRPFDSVVQLSLSLFAAFSFISIFVFGRRYGLQKFLFLDKLCNESEKVRRGYTQQIQHSMKLLSAFVLPCFVVDSAYKIWWFSSGGTQIPYFYNMVLSKVVVCVLLMCSWLYRISICFLVCILFRLTCFLQILRLEDFAQVFDKQSDVASILMEHLRIRRNLRVISHRFRLFILSTLILVTVSQFFSLLVTTKPSSPVNLFSAGEVALCSVTLVTGLFICLQSAAKITHRAQSVTSLAAKWHAFATMSSFDEEGDKICLTPIVSLPEGHSSHYDEDAEEGDGDNMLDNTNLMPAYTSTISYQKRQALVTYFEHNRAGITVYGFMLDRTLLHTIFAIQLSLTLWILNKTIGIS